MPKEIGYYLASCRSIIPTESAGERQKKICQQIAERLGNTATLQLYDSVRDLGNYFIRLVYPDGLDHTSSLGDIDLSEENVLKLKTSGIRYEFALKKVLLEKTDPKLYEWV